MTYSVALAATALALDLAGSAAAADPCFRTRDMRNHTILDDQTLYVGVGAKDVWRVGVKGNCLAGATSSDALVIRTTGSSGLVCKPLDLDLSVRRGSIPSACLVDATAKLTPEQVAAIPKGKKP